MPNLAAEEGASSATSSDGNSDSRSSNKSVKFTKQSIEDTLSSFSWFAVLWTCQRDVQVKVADQSPANSSSCLNLQFWVIYKFNFDGRRASGDSDLGVVGLLAHKLGKESFWLTPTAFDCENNLQGQLFDETCDDNIMKLSDMQEKAIRFMQAENQAGSCGDFQFLMKASQMMQL